MCRFWDISLMIFLSVSVMFVGADNTAELPPPKNLNFIWETPFRLSLTWEAPEDLDPNCKVNYTVVTVFSQNCSSGEKIDTRRVTTQNLKVNIGNENGLCISVSTNPEDCGQRSHSQSTNITIPPPPVRLVTDRRYEYSKNKMKCTWSPAEDVQDLSFYYWLPRKESVIKCIPDETMKTGGCIIHETFTKNMMEMFYLFNGTLNGIPVNNTFKDEGPLQYVKLNKPQLTISRVGQYLHFQADGSDLDEFVEDCYHYHYTYSKCNKNSSEIKIDNKTLEVQYDPACKYRASVQVHFSDYCGKGKSDPSDEVEYATSG